MLEESLAPTRLSSGPAPPDLPFPSLGAGLTSGSSTNTNSFSTASMAAGPHSPHNSDATLPLSPWPTDGGGESLPVSGGSGTALPYMGANRFP